MPRTKSNGPKPEKATAGIMVTVPTELAKIIDARASESNMNRAAWVRQLVATTVEYKLPVTTRVRAPNEQYMVTLPDGTKRPMTADEKKQAISDKNKTERATLRAVLAAARAGKLDLSAVIAEFGAKPEAEAQEAVTA